MKKLKLLSLLVAPAIVLPLVFSITSCSSLDSTYRIIDANSVNKHYYHDLKKPGPSIKSLLWGDKGFNKGNYVLFITHSIYEPSINFLLDQKIYLKDANPVVQNGTTSSNTCNLLDAITNPIYTNQLPDTSYQFVSIIEQDRMASYCGTYNQETEQPCSPFEKYTEQDEKYNDKHKKDQYVRNDADAKAYRGLVDTVSKLFNLTAGSGDDFIAIQWVKGYSTKTAIKSATLWTSSSEFCVWLYTNNQSGESWK